MSENYPTLQAKASRWTRWRHSLYARAFLFTAAGSGALLGAIAVQSTLMIRSSVDQLLEDRIQLVRTTGTYVEQWIQRELGDISGVVSDVLGTVKVGATAAQIESSLEEALKPLHAASVFQEGAFVLDPRGELLAGIPSRPDELRQVLDLPAMASQVRAGGKTVVSSLVHLPPGDRPVLVFLAPVRNVMGELLGFAGGVLHPAAKNLLDMFGKLQTPATTMHLLDATGIVVATTRPSDLFTATDHGSMLTQAIKSHREIHGRCHGCHEAGENNKAVRNVEVLAFAPLPTLALGMAVRQPERQALAPAFKLQARLVLLGSTFVVLFLISTALSVHSVVSPLVRLTRAVRAQEVTDSAVPLPNFGKDEVGQLARALTRARNRVLESLAEVRQHEAALHLEVDKTRRHLTLLQNIAEYSSTNMDFATMVERGLDNLLGFAEAPAGALVLVHPQGRSVSVRGLTETRAAELFGQNLSMARARLTDEDADIGVAHTRFLDVEGMGLSLVADLKVPQGLAVQCLIASGEKGRNLGIEERHVDSFLHQFVMSAANRLLHEQEAARNQQSREYLSRLLKAQEAERLRIARELHDTIAQDLAAHRLQLERLARADVQEKGTGNKALSSELDALERQAHDMLAVLRQLLVDLRPSVLDTMGFLPALQWYLEKLHQDSHIRGALVVEGEEKKISHDTEVTLFRIFQECLRNVAMHSQAENVIVTVTFGDDKFEMVIEDDGKGFSVPEVTKGTVRPDGHGLGILGMMERAKLLGGAVAFESTPGEGSTVRVSVPLNPVTRGGE